MNYYNNQGYYQYPYNGNNQFVAQYQMPTLNSQPPQPQQVLNGKMVDSVDIVKVTEVPIGGYGIFPKADLSEIYIKSWNPNGTTNITTFKPIISPSPVAESLPSTTEINTILEKINLLDSKIDAVLGQSVVTTSPAANKKEISANDY